MCLPAWISLWRFWITKVASQILWVFVWFFFCHYKKCMPTVLSFSVLYNCHSPFIWGRSFSLEEIILLLKEVFLIMVQLIDFSCIACSSTDSSILPLQTVLYGFFHIVYWKMFYYNLYENITKSKAGAHLMWSNYILTLKWSIWKWQNEWGWQFVVIRVWRSS